MGKQDNILAKSLKLIFRSSGIWLWINLILSLLKNLLPLVLIIFLKYFIDTASSNFSLQNNTMQVFWYVILFIGILLLTALTSFLSGKASIKQNSEISEFMYNQIHRAINRVSFAHFESPQFRKKLYRIGRELDFRPQMIISEITATAYLSITSIIVIGLLYSFHFSVLIFIPAITIPYFVLHLKQGKKKFSDYESNTINEVRQSYYNRILTEPVFAKEMRLFGLHDFFLTKFKDAYSTAEKSRKKSEDEILSRELVFQILLAALIGLYIYYMVTYTNILTYSTGSFVMYVLLFIRAQSAILATTRSASAVMNNTRFLKDFFELTTIPEKKQTIIDEKQKKEKLFSESITFKNVSFRYPESHFDALKNISLRIPAGKKVAIVGRNGAGKSTLVKLLLKLYDPVDGEILFDDIPANELPSERIHEKTSCLFQDFVLYNLTVKENIELGDINKIDHHKLLEVSKVAGIEDKIKHLKSGFETMIGNLFPESEELSIGEWQKLAFARAAYRNADLVILDEPTSALDAQTESGLIKSVFSMQNNNTLIIISHRLNMVSKADIIYVIDDGKIIEFGSHIELMEKSGLYSEMYNLQAGSYI